jgi:phosphopantothenoylcysteine decarboxylase/phosphopantothenate--cysteine ligase
LVSGPVGLPDPPGLATIHVETAREMLAAVESTLPTHIFIGAAAVSDWRVAEAADDKIKKGSGGPPQLRLVENPDILATVAKNGPLRPRLVVGFAAETRDVLGHARSKLLNKGCDLVVANDVSDGTGVMGGVRNTVHLVDANGVESWPTLDKEEVAVRLIDRLAHMLERGSP